MGTRTVRAGGDDDEVDPVMALGHDRLRDVAPDLAFGAARSQPLPHPGVDTVDSVAGGPQPLYLVGGLAQAERSQHRAGSGQPGFREDVTEAQHLLGPHPVGDPESGRRVSESVTEQTGGQGEGIVGLAVADQAHEVGGAAGCRGRRLEQWHNEDRVTGGRDQQGGEAFQRQGVVPDEVAQVRPGRDDQCIDARVLCRACRPTQPFPQR
jgi:hypothetical protein